MWRPIDTAPRDGTKIDVWVTGEEKELSFYCTEYDRRGGRVPHVQWHKNGPNEPSWYICGGIMAYALTVSGLSVTHWQPIPDAP